MNIFKAMAVRSVEEAARAIPVIDVGPAFRGEPGALEAVAGEVRHACEKIGFFYMTDHGAPTARARSSSRKAASTGTSS